MTLLSTLGGLFAVLYCRNQICFPGIWKEGHPDGEVVNLRVRPVGSRPCHGNQVRPSAVDHQHRCHVFHDGTPGHMCLLPIKTREWIRGLFQLCTGAAAENSDRRAADWPARPAAPPVGQDTGGRSPSTPVPLSYSYHAHRHHGLVGRVTPRTVAVWQGAAEEKTTRPQRWRKCGLHGSCRHRRGGDEL